VVFPEVARFRTTIVPLDVVVNGKLNNRTSSTDLSVLSS